ncbi:MAG: OmpA family protein [Nannocystis sp.]|nr:OmpA family protein [Nannocystis sp.]
MGALPPRPRPHPRLPRLQARRPTAARRTFPGRRSRRGSAGRRRPRPAARPPVAAEFPLDGARIVLPAPITFDADGAALSPAADPALYHLLDYLSAKESVSLVRIEGHAPEQALSEARALTVARWLVAHGVACERLVPIGFGPTKPVADASTPEGRAANVRIDAINAALRGRLIGGMPADGGGQLAGDPCR